MARGSSLKSALINAQHASADKAAKAKQEQARLLKHKSITGANKSQRLAGTARAKDTVVEKSGKKNAPENNSATRTPLKCTSPFDSDDTILLIGEGNFSYALSLISPPHSHPAHLVLATAYDSESVCYEKYSDAEDHVRRIREAGARVEFGVDAGKLGKSKAVGKGARWSRIVFNFPHAGAGIKDQDRNILTNQHLILSFLRSCPPLLTQGPSRFPSVSNGENNDRATQKRLKQSHRDRVRDAAVEKWENGDGGPADEVELDLEEEEETLLANEDISSAEQALTDALSTGAAKDFSPPRKQGTVLITLKNSPPYTLWDIHHLATRPPILTPQQHSVPTGTVQPRYRLLRSFAFEPSFWPGYEHRRTLGFKQGVSKDGNFELFAAGGGSTEGKCRTWEFAVREDGRRR